jgi:tetratricopeptide (TPR) repeat protein
LAPFLLRSAFLQVGPPNLNILAIGLRLQQEALTLKVNITMARPYELCLALVALTVVLFLGTPMVGHASSSATITNSFQDRAQEAYRAARLRFQKEKANAEAAWQFARATFDWAEFARNDEVRADLAKEGMAAAQKAIELDGKSAAAHYYMGMNLGQLARTKSLGALKIVLDMERDFKKARELDEQLDFAGPDRNLGLLYLEAPTFSVGDRKKARIHLLRAVELRPQYPENRLNMIEAYLKWEDKTSAHRELLALEKILDRARKELAGVAWEGAWVDWERRLQKVRQQLKDFSPAK